MFALEEEPWAWPAEPDAAGAVLTVARLASAQAALGSLAADREAASAPRVTVASAPRRQEDRCPFCWRALDAAPADDGPGPGPPLRCAGCGTAHHRDCLGDHRACTVLGCDSPTAVRLGVELPIEGLGCEAPA